MPEGTHDWSAVTLLLLNLMQALSCERREAAPKWRRHCGIPRNVSRNHRQGTAQDCAFVVSMVGTGSLRSQIMRYPFRGEVTK